jgi:glutaredoxin-like protein NrdH
VCSATPRTRHWTSKVDISLDSEARDYVMALGYLQAPVVVAGNEHWSGFRPDRIKALAGAVLSA